MKMNRPINHEACPPFLERSPLHISTHLLLWRNLNSQTTCDTCYTSDYLKCRNLEGPQAGQCVENNEKRAGSATKSRGGLRRSWISVLHDPQRSHRAPCCVHQPTIANPPNRTLPAPNLHPSLIILRQKSRRQIQKWPRHNVWKCRLLGILQGIAARVSGCQSG